MIDTTIYERMDCRVESHYNRTFAKRQIYKLKFSVQSIDNFDWCRFKLILSSASNEQNNLDFSETKVITETVIEIKKHFNTSLKKNLINSLEAGLGTNYIVEEINDELYIIASIKGKAGSTFIPKLTIRECIGISIDLIDHQFGEDTYIFVPTNKRNVIHIPVVGRGEYYISPQVGDRLIIVDSIEDQDRTFTREVVKVETNAQCTCDIIELDLPIDRISKSHNRIDGVGLARFKNLDNRYTSALEKTHLYVRKKNYLDILQSRGKEKNVCLVPFNDVWNIKQCSNVIIENELKPFNRQYFGSVFNWKKYEQILKPIYDRYGQYLTDHLFLLTSSSERPEYLVHKDYHHHISDQPVVGSLTWPIKNCDEKSITVWYNCDDLQIESKFQRDRAIYSSEISLTEVDRYTFLSNEFNPGILRHDIWHTVYNNNGSRDERVLMQWRFRPGLSWSEIVNVCSDLVSLK